MGKIVSTGLSRLVLSAASMGHLALSGRPHIRILVFGALCALLAAGTPSASYAQRVLGDYDGDGYSDLSVALVDRTARTTAWLTRVGEQKQPLFWTWGLPGDALVSGNFFGNGRYYPGIVFVRSAQTPLEWWVKNPSGTDTFFHYGLPGDHIPNQADMDCDGVTDLIVVRNGTPTRFQGFRLWYVALSGSGGIVQESVFGLTTDRVGVADLDGDGCAEQVALRGDTYQWFGKKLFGVDVSVVQWGLPGDKPLLPQDVNGDGAPDYVVVRPTGAGQVAFVRYGANSSGSEQIGSDTAVPILGKFRRAPGSSFAWTERATGWTAMRPTRGADLVFPFTIAANAIIRPDGTVVQPDDDARFGGPGGGGGGGGGGAF
ncbi:MAG: hypothetical protein KDD69_18840, partial [Bdellovibrionales bacterium]|nr:hypothetical protein [Bdellovibrionales bacterium]